MTHPNHPKDKPTSLDLARVTIKKRSKDKLRLLFGPTASLSFAAASVFTAGPIAIGCAIGAVASALFHRKYGIKALTNLQTRSYRPEILAKEALAALPVDIKNPKKKFSSDLLGTIVHLPEKDLLDAPAPFQKLVLHSQIILYSKECLTAQASIAELPPVDLINMSATEVMYQEKFSTEDLFKFRDQLKTHPSCQRMSKILSARHKEPARSIHHPESMKLINSVAIGAFGFLVSSAILEMLVPGSSEMVKDIETMGLVCGTITSMMPVAAIQQTLKEQTYGRLYPRKFDILDSQKLLQQASLTEEKQKAAFIGRLSKTEKFSPK